MMREICFQWIEPCRSERLRVAQEKLQERILDLGLEPVLYPAGPEMVKFADILRFARERAKGGSFVWCNSDVTLVRNPYDVLGEGDDGATVHGFHRRELPSGEICGGVDMYLIPCKAWDEWVGINPPDLWCGATHIDWWLSRAPALRGCYRSHFGYIDHLTHPESPASKGGNTLYNHNIREYNRWARESGAGRFERRVSLPFIGESLSPISDLIKKISGISK
jgi:hypothetical protein